MKRFFSILIITVLLVSVIFCVPTSATYEELFEKEFHSECYYLICTDNNEVIFSNNPDKQVKCASLTKIATATVILENVTDLQQVITVPESCLEELKGTGSSTGGLKAGETYTIYDLLCCLLIESANDAATVLANYLTGENRQDFIDKMNNLCTELGLVNTHFMNVHGLDADNHYSSAADMAALLRNAMKYPVFAEISGMRSYELPESNMQNKRTITNTNKTLNSAIKDYYCRYINGGKTGYTSGAGQCLAVSASNNGYNYIAVALGGTKDDIDDDGVGENGSFVDCKNMLEWAFTNLRLISIADSAKVVGEVKVKYGKTDFVSLSPSATAFSLMPKNADSGSLIVKVIENTKPEYVKAPIQEGQVICKGEVYYAGKVISTIDLVASAPIKRSLLSTIGTGLINLVKSPAFEIVLVIVVALFITLLWLRRMGILNGRKDKIKVVNYNDFFKNKKDE